MSIQNVGAPEVIEQRLVYLEDIVDVTKNPIVRGDWGRAVQHSSTFHESGLESEGMLVG